VPPLTVGAAAFRKRLRAIRRDVPGIAWYPYDPLASLEPLREIELPLGAGPLADIGCADGDMAFFLESLGFEVDAIDNSAANHNGLRGAGTLRDALGSRVRIHDIDLDTSSRCPEALQLRLLSRHPVPPEESILRAGEPGARDLPHAAEHARGAGGGRGHADSHAAGGLPARHARGQQRSHQLLDLQRGRLEAHPGPRRMEHYRLDHHGSTERSDPATRDERAFCLLESRYASRIEGELLHGWHAIEEGGWRWTERRFAVRPSGSGPAVSMSFTALQPVTLAAAIDGEPVAPQRYEAGEHVWSHEAGPAPRSSSPWTAPCRREPTRASWRWWSVH